VGRVVGGVGTGKEPSAARKLVGELLKIHRKRAGMTQKDLAEQALVSESLEGAFERAERIPGREFLILADKVLDAGGALKACIEAMEEEKYPPNYLDWVKLEATAVVINAFESMLVPGLLQVPTYMRALFRMRVPAFDEDEIDRRADARLERQAVLIRKPRPVVGYVVEQSALERPIGGDEVRKEQLLHLLEIRRTLPDVTLQVMPTRRHEHAGLMGSMQLVSAAEGRNFVYADKQGGGTLISKPEEVNLLMQQYGILRAQALTPWESTELIEGMASEL
jgi:transcriptional regulator with XRE-family HTH domain